jgi:hypothetical protein
LGIGFTIISNVELTAALQASNWPAFLIGSLLIARIALLRIRNSDLTEVLSDLDTSPTESFGASMLAFHLLRRATLPLRATSSTGGGR